MAVVIGFAAFAVGTRPPLDPWHTAALTEEFSAQRDGRLDFDGYLELESRLFAEQQAVQARWAPSEALRYSRFNPASAVSQLAEGARYNRSFRLEQPDALGHALLIHGLSDSPYSMRALAESLHGRGFAVTVLRVPGHGTFPSMLARATARDWSAAVRIAAADVARRTPADQLFYVGGYSTGGTLALDLALASLHDPSIRRPDRVMLISPAITLTRVAALATVLDVVSRIPIPGLQQAGWQEIGVEYDPYKFNSFPVHATRQVNRATTALQNALAEADRTGRIARLPPVTAWQSVVDSTVGPNGLADLVFSRLRGPQHRLVLFDVNRHDALGSVQRPGAHVLIDRLATTARGYTLDVVTNTTAQTRAISVRTFPANGTRQVRGTGLEWPGSLVSLGHVALPFRPDDPVYGLDPGSGRGGIPSIGTWLFRGESGAVTVDLRSLTRPRSNPFWSLVDEEVGRIVDADAKDRPRQRLPAGSPQASGTATGNAPVAVRPR